MRCPICAKRRIAQGDRVCRTCRAFITEYIDTGAIRPRPVPLATDVLMVMRQLGVDQDRAVRALGGTP